MRKSIPLFSSAAVGVCAHAASAVDCPPWRLAPADAPEGARYGYYVAIDEPWAVVNADNGGGHPVEPPVLFHWTGLGWDEWGMLDVQCESGSSSVSVDGDRVAVATACQDVLLFRFDGNEWVHDGTLTGSGNPQTSFGLSVHVRGDRCIVGEYGHTNTGRAFIFRYVDGAWGLEAELTAEDGEIGDFFGWSVSVDGTAAVVGARLDDIDNCVTPPACGGAGSVYVFEVVDGAWQQRAKLHAPNESAGTGLGAAVAIRGDVAVGTASGRNEAYRFRRSTNNTWQLEDTLQGAANSSFGWGYPGASLGNGLCVVGSHNADGTRGEAWAWGADIRETLNAPNGMPSDWLGVSVGVGAQFAIAGAPGDDMAIPDGGAAWVFPVLSSDAPDCNHNWVHDMIDICSGSPDCNASGVPDECEIAVVSTDPPSGAIDARQPTNVDGTGSFGWDYVDVVFSSSAVELHPADFVVEELGAVGTPIDVLLVLPLGGNTYRLLLSSPIRPNRWTVVRNNCIGEIVRLGFLPGDVNADRLSRPLDILSLIDALNGVGVARPIWSTDIDRSGLATPADILREIDLLNGAGAFDVFNGATLP